MRPWLEAWHQALYGPDGFYRRPEGPAGHFRTAVHAAPDLLAAALARLAGLAGCGTVLDVGAGRGELLTALAAADPGLRLHGVDVVPRPAGLPEPIGWSTIADNTQLPRLPGGVLLVAWELLDVVPCRVLEPDSDGTVREVLVGPDGTEQLGAATRSDWSRRWWPAARPGSRVEEGSSRDEAWAALLAAVPDGLLLAVDYGLTEPAPHGTLTGYRAGRQVPPVPDGSCDLTAHVFWPSLRRPGDRLLTQREALRALGFGPEPASFSGTALSGTAPSGTTLERLVHRGRVGELTDPGGLGGFGWLLAGAGRPIPDLFGGLSGRLFGPQR